MAIVTLSRQLGTPGEELAARLASLLGCRLMDSEGLDREMSRRGLASSVKERWEAVLLRELADRETLVVLGLAGQCVFADRKDAVHVRLVGSWEGRTRRLVAERSVSEVEAAGLLVQSDRERAERIRRRYGVDWNDPSLYHLVINADRTPPAQAARLLSALVEAQAGAAPPMGASPVARVLPPGVPAPPPTVDEDLSQPSPAPAALQAAAIQPGEQASTPVPAAGTGSRSRRRRRRGRNRAEGSPPAAGGAPAPGAAPGSAGPHPAAMVAGEPAGEATGEPAGEATGEPAGVPAAQGRATAEPVIYGISKLKPGLPPHLRPYPSQHAVCSWEHKRPAFAHPSEEEFARMLDFYQIRWVYEPTTFPIEWDAKGNMTAAFTPDFYLPDIDTFIELTTMKQNLTARKNRKIRRLRQLYPGIDVKIFYGRDFRSLLRKYGKDDEEDRLTGSIDGPAAQNGAESGQKAPRVLPPPTPRAAARGGEAVREPAAEAVAEGLAEPPAQPPAVPAADRAADRVFHQAVDAAADGSVGTAAKVAADQVASPAADRVADGAAKPASAAVPEPVAKARDAQAAEPEAEPVAAEPAVEPAVEPAAEPAAEAATPVAGAAAEAQPVTGSAPAPASEGAKKPRRQRRARSATSGASAGSKAAAAAAGSRRRTGTGRRRKSTAAPQQADPGTQPQGPDGAGDSLEVEARQLDQGRHEVAAAAEEASPATALTVTGSPATAAEGAGTAAADAAGACAAAVDGAPAAAAGQGTQGAGKRAPARRPARRRRTRTESGR